MLFVKNLTEVTVQSLEKMHSVTVQNEHVTAFCVVTCIPRLEAVSL